MEVHCYELCFKLSNKYRHLNSLPRKNPYQIIVFMLLDFCSGLFPASNKISMSVLEFPIQVQVDYQYFLLRS